MAEEKGKREARVLAQDEVLGSRHVEDSTSPPHPNPPKPWSKWTADTERAFLLALRLTGQASKAAAEIGRSRNTAFSRRKTHPEFARRWDEAVAAQQAEWIAAHQERLAAVRCEIYDDGEAREGSEEDVHFPGVDWGDRRTPWRERAGGWDARKRGLFLRTLARTKSARDAAHSAGMSISAAYYLRGQSSRFARAWDKAVAEGPRPSVIEAAMQRAVEGWNEPIVHGGRIVGYRRRHSEVLLRELLRSELGDGRGPSGRQGKHQVRQYASREETDAALEKKLDFLEARVRAREERAAREAHRADWEEWKASWTGAGGLARRFVEDEAEEAVA